MGGGWAYMSAALAVVAATRRVRRVVVFILDGLDGAMRVGDGGTTSVCAIGKMERWKDGKVKRGYRWERREQRLWESWARALSSTVHGLPATRYMYMDDELHRT